MYLEVGKFYQTRDGDKVGPMRDDWAGEDVFHWHVAEGRLNGCLWDAAGKSATQGCSYDLVAEWMENSDEPVAPRDPVNHPAHYMGHPSGVECIQITEHMGFNLGNAVKYIWRADEKGDAVENLRKARWYLDREIARRGQ